MRKDKKQLLNMLKRQIKKKGKDISVDSFRKGYNLAIKHAMEWVEFLIN